MMRQPLIRRLHGNHDESGITMVLVAIAMVAIIGMATLSIDVVTLYLARQEAQRSADAAALAAARVLSMSGVTGDPGNVGAAWPTICGVATQVAKATARVNPVSGAAPLAGNITVTFQYNGTSSSNCTFAGGTGAFAINPQVQVQVVRAGLPTLFSRYWSRAPNTVSATALAEVFNPSNSGSVSPGNSVVPVNPRCVKPWFVPNSDPGNSGNKFVDATTGQIQNPGIFLKNGGVIGESFTLFADCPAGPSCTSQPDTPPASNSAGGPNSLDYLPGLVEASSVAVPGCATGSVYQKAVAGCDQNTIYQCGVPKANLKNEANVIDVTNNPGGGGGDTATGVACSLTNSATVPPDGQDTLTETDFPFTITAGSANPQVTSGTVITSSKSIVSFPIYDSAAPLVFNGNNQAQVVIVGFLQVFVNGVDPTGNVSVTVLNVAGCGGVATNAPVNGSSPVPVRLITPQ